MMTKTAAGLRSLCRTSTWARVTLVKMVIVVLLLLGSLGAMIPDEAGAVCNADYDVMLNAMGTTCWECVFPISMSGFTLMNTGEDNVDPAIGPGVAGYYPPELCGCICIAGVCITGLPIGLFMPTNLVEAVHDPFCFPSLGMNLASAYTYIGAGSETTQLDDELNHGVFHVHYWLYPLWYLIGIWTDIGCANYSGTEADIVFMSELDPTWTDDIMNLMLFPEALLIANPIALTACAADSLAASITFPIDALFWCAGSFGYLYPPDGNVSGAGTDLGAAALTMSRMLAKLSRVGFEFYTAGNGAEICRDYPTGLIVKSQYKFQLMAPIPNVGVGGPCCSPLGRTLMRWGLGKTIPAVGEDFVWLIWKLQRCCLG